MSVQSWNIFWKLIVFRLKGEIPVEISIHIFKKHNFPDYGNNH